MVSIFFSYSHEDAATAAAIESALAKRGIAVWRDNQLVGGNPWTEKLNEQFALRRNFLFLLSRHSMDPARYQRYELHVANETKKRIIPVYHQITPQEVAVKLPILAPLTGIQTSDPDAVAERVSQILRQDVLYLGGAERAALALALADLDRSVDGANRALRLAGVDYRVPPGRTPLAAWHDAIVVAEAHEVVADLVGRFIASAEQPYAAATRRAAAILAASPSMNAPIERRTVQSDIDRLVRDGIVGDADGLRAYAVLHVWPKAPFDAVPRDKESRQRIAADCQPLMAANGTFADPGLPLRLAADVIADRLTPSMLKSHFGSIAAAPADAKSAIAVALTWAPPLCDAALQEIKRLAGGAPTAAPSQRLLDLRICLAWLAILREGGVAAEAVLQAVVRGALASGHAALAVSALEVADERRADSYQAIWSNGDDAVSAARAVKRLAENGSSVTALDRSLAAAVSAAVVNAKDESVDALRTMRNNVLMLWLAVVGPLVTDAQERLLFDQIARPMRSPVDGRLSEAAASALAECDDLAARWHRLGGLRAKWVARLSAAGPCEPAKRLLESLGNAGVAADHKDAYFSLQRYCTGQDRGTTRG